MIMKNMLSYRHTGRIGEYMDIVINQNVTINDPDLKKITTEIRKASANVIGNTFKIAGLIAHVDAKKLYESDGFNDTFDYVKQCFGLEKASAYNLIRVGNDFITEVKKGNITSFETLLKHGVRDYSISQVFKMLPLGIEKAKELTDDGVIDETMSCRQIEKIVKENTEGTKARGKSKTEPSDEPNDETEFNQVIIDWDIVPDDVKKWFTDHFEIDENTTEISIVL